MQVCLPAVSSTVHTSPPTDKRKLEPNQEKLKAANLFRQTFVFPLSHVWRNPVHVKQLAENNHNQYQGGNLQNKKPPLFLPNRLCCSEIPSVHLRIVY